MKEKLVREGEGEGEEEEEEEEGEDDEEVEEEEDEVGGSCVEAIVVFFWLFFLVFERSKFTERQQSEQKN